MTDKQVREKVEAYITETEADLMLQEQSILFKIKLLSAPFTDPEHPANHTLLTQIKKDADLGDYSLIERVNSLVADLQSERAKILVQMERLRRTGDND